VHALAFRRSVYANAAGFDRAGRGIGYIEVPRNIHAALAQYESAPIATWFHTFQSKRGS
jgi:hypothetical protein